MHRFSGLLFLATITGCAAEGGDDGGAANLPDRGISGWERPDNDAPLALQIDDAALAGGSAIVVGGRVLIYGHRINGDGSFELFRVLGDATGLVFDTPTSLGIAGRDPSIVFEGDRYWLAYTTTEGIAIATSVDGVAFTVQPSSGIAAERTHPSIVVEGERVRLYLSTGTTLVHTEATTTLAFGAETEVLAPGLACVATDGEAEDCWDADAITEAEVRRARTGTGQVVYRMFYAAHDGGSTDLGFAASYDGLAFARYPYNPVLEGTGNERSPTSVLANESYVLFWDEIRNPPEFNGIQRAEHVPSAPSDRW